MKKAGKKKKQIIINQGKLAVRLRILSCWSGQARPTCGCRRPVEDIEGSPVTVDSLWLTPRVCMRLHRVCGLSQRLVFRYGTLGKSMGYFFLTGIDEDVHKPCE